jgi:hypothetical protein
VHRLLAARQIDDRQARVTQHNASLASIERLDEMARCVWPTMRERGSHEAHRTLGVVPRPSADSACNATH